ncbi:hypothetical protein V8D89_001313 [Ganoderma adspersum]
MASASSSFGLWLYSVTFQNVVFVYGVAEGMPCIIACSQFSTFTVIYCFRFLLNSTSLRSPAAHMDPHGHLQVSSRIRAPR